jgi:hypothetical protein
VKHIRGVLINEVIHNFKQAAFGIKPGQQELVVMPLNKTIKKRTIKSAAYVFGSHTFVLERRIIEDDGVVYA